MISRRRRIELSGIYAAAVFGIINQRYIRKQYFRYLAALYKEGNELRVFMALRRLPRRNGARIDLQLVQGKISYQTAFRKIRAHCADEYARGLTAVKIASIRLDDRNYKRLTRRMAFEVLKAFEGVDPNDKTQVCTQMAKTWHQFVRELHRMYDLPTVRELRAISHVESDAELQVLDSDDFETPLSPEDLQRLERRVT